MSNPIIHGFRHVTTFSGRDRRGRFWPYAAVVLVLGFVVLGVAVTFSLGGYVTEVQQFAVAHPEATTVESSPGSWSISIDANHPDAPVPDLDGFFVSMGIGVLAIIAGLAAAVSRRLHDSGRSALWGLLPVPFLLFGIGFFPVMMDSMMASEQPDLTLFFLLFGNNVLYLGALGTLVILLSLPTRPEANRHGAPPT
ncbi:DUF805 domain-containing protein [Roseibacterium beibuensis]|uniref:DUF805 domain-containing protein n=1 Tax=[Roseibacterium] beibuensis TaxID=1193142 RepID=UPI00217F1966|nr:DUF805 domain-containing protein [Roseibacterium beibuensis]MCS6624690.1 DUF805 domain-containing protein [Roseibacterium beibuensis]